MSLVALDICGRDCVSLHDCSDYRQLADGDPDADEHVIRCHINLIVLFSLATPALGAL